MIDLARGIDVVFAAWAADGSSGRPNAAAPVPVNQSRRFSRS